MSFEDVMMKRLAKCHAEACREILASMKKGGRSLSDAVTDAIEVLPASQSRDLRRWLKDWEAWEEWLAFKKKGWSIRKLGKGILALTIQSASDGSFPPLYKGPSERVIAAGAGVSAIKDSRGGWEQFEDKRGRIFYDKVYEVTREL
jgi:lambda repressor-like predicted transcriptional regulator